MSRKHRIARIWNDAEMTRRMGPGEEVGYDDITEDKDGGMTAFSVMVSTILQSGNFRTGPKYCPEGRAYLVQVHIPIIARRPPESPASPCYTLSKRLHR